MKKTTPAKSGAELRRRMLKEHNIDSTAALALLDTAACALDQALEAEAIMAREGLSTPGTRGPRAHPLCNVARDARNRLIASLRSLNLEL